MGDARFGTRDSWSSTTNRHIIVGAAAKKGRQMAAQLAAAPARSRLARRNPRRTTNQPKRITTGRMPQILIAAATPSRRPPTKTRLLVGLSSGGLIAIKLARRQ